MQQKAITKEHAMSLKAGLLLEVKSKHTGGLALV